MSSLRSWPGRVMWRVWAFPPASVWAVVPWLLLPAAVLLTAGPVGEADVYWHVRLGLDFLATGRVTGDPAWTFGPASSTWASTQVGAEVVLAWLYTAFGWPGVAAVRMVMLCALIMSVWGAATAVSGRRGSVPAARAAVLVTVIVSVAFMSFFEERPQALSLVILPWLGVAAVRLAYTGRWPCWWVWGAAVMVWSWFHAGGLMVDPVLVLAAVARIASGTAGPRRAATWAACRAGWPVLLAVVIAPMLGPNGPEVYRHTAEISAAATGIIAEWQPAATSTTLFCWLLVLLGVWAALLVMIAGRRGRVGADMVIDAVVAGGLLLSAVSVSRNILLSLVVLAPFVAYRAGQALRQPAPDWEGVPVRVAALVAAGSVLAAVAAGLVVGPGAAAVPPDRPARVWAAIAGDTGREHRLFVDYNVGGQAGILTGAAVSIDGRSDRYGHDGIVDHDAVMKGLPGWRDIWARYPGVTDVVVPEDAGLVERLTSDGWAEVCTDGGYTWLVPAGVTARC